MSAMVVDPEGPFDHFDDTLGGPQVGAKAVRECVLDEQPNQAATLRPGESGWPTGRAAHLQRPPHPALPRIAPAHHRAGRAPQFPAHVVEGHPGVQQLQGQVAPCFQVIGRTLLLCYLYTRQ